MTFPVQGTGAVEFRCVLDGSVVGTVGIEVEGERRPLVIRSPWGRVLFYEYPQQPVEDEGFHDETRGSCPRRHERMLLD